MDILLLHNGGGGCLSQLCLISIREESERLQDDIAQKNDRSWFGVDAVEVDKVTAATI
jgi:hypothetical protein